MSYTTVLQKRGAASCTHLSMNSKPLGYNMSWQGAVRMSRNAPREDRKPPPLNRQCTFGASVAHPNSTQLGGYGVTFGLQTSKSTSISPQVFPTTPPRCVVICASMLCTSGVTWLANSHRGDEFTRGTYAFLCCKKIGPRSGRSCLWLRR